MTLLRSHRLIPLGRGVAGGGGAMATGYDDVAPMGLL